MTLLYELVFLLLSAFQAFCATGITGYLDIEKAQQAAAHESARTTKLYDRTSDTITLDEIEKIAI